MRIRSAAAAAAAAVAVLAVCGPGCAGRPYRGPMRGTWSISMTVRSTLPGYRVRPGATARGVVTVPDPTPVLPRALPPDDVPADVRVDMAPLGVGFVPSPQPVVRDLPGDSVRVELGRAAGDLVLLGRRTGDSVTGTWWRQGRAAGADGRFVMRRIR